MKKILVAIESCETVTIASPIMQHALELATAFASKVWLLHVAPPLREPPYNVDSKMTRHETAVELHNEHDFLQYLARCMQDRDVDAAALLAQGSVIKTILNESERLAVDLILVGCHQHSRLYGALMDSTEEGLLSKCKRPVMFVPG